MSEVQINLLDWREAARARRTRRFWLAVALSALAGVGLALMATLWLQWGLKQMEARQQHVAAAVERLEEKSAEMTDLERQLSLLDQEQALLERLQDERRQTLAVVNALAATLSPGVRYRRIERSDDRLRVEGEAVDSARLVEQLRSLERAQVFAEPLLSRVEAEQGHQHFALEMTLVALPGLEVSP
ncbi:PilN domain-containing protein [Halomonas sp.]|uniref:PilN domain-containing protein n=1 Tax=Halomonas sp. TaxID=1486246 RepID=UPI000C9815CD|nr:PilN domain-containing protein [Halomonas sp.]MAR74489.1 fimbrial assembly protein [Halomonas sp.]